MAELHPWYPVCGCDVSKHQLDIDYLKLVSGGLWFVIARSSIGLEKDKYYQKNLNSALLHDVPFGAYHYWWPNIAAAKNVQTMQAMVVERPVLGCWLDVESTIGKMTRLQSSQHILDTLNGMDDAFGALTGIYSSNSKWGRLVDPSFYKRMRISERPLWVANYLQGFAKEPATMPDGWPRWDFWQFSAQYGPHKGKSSEFGVPLHGSKSLDINAFRGDVEEFRSLYSGVIKPPVEPPKPPIEPPIVINTIQEYRVANDLEIWRLIYGGKKFKSWRSPKTVPQINHTNPTFDAPVWLSEPLQHLIVDINPGMTGAGWRSLMKRDRCFSDHGAGYGGEPRADFINGKDLDATLPRITKQFICGGAVIRGKMDGDFLIIETLKADAPIPDAGWLLDRPWLWYWAVTVRPDGSIGMFPQNGNNGVKMPYITKGIARARLQVRAWGKPFPYIERMR